MSELTKATVRPPTNAVLRSRVVAAIGEFIATAAREDWIRAFSSNQLRLAIDDEGHVSIADAQAISTRLFSVPLGALDLDCWAVELGGAVRDAALDNIAQAVLRAFERPKWWVA